LKYQTAEEGDEQPVKDHRGGRDLQKAGGKVKRPAENSLGDLEQIQYHADSERETNRGTVKVDHARRKKKESEHLQEDKYMTMQRIKKSSPPNVRRKAISGQCRKGMQITEQGRKPAFHLKGRRGRTMISRHVTIRQNRVGSENSRPPPTNSIER